MMEARARTEAEPVVVVSHQTMVNWTNLLPKREEACPVKTTQKFLMDLGSSPAWSVLGWMSRSALLSAP